MYRSILLATAASLTLLSPAQAQDNTSEDDPTWRQDTVIVTGQQGAYRRRDSWRGAYLDPAL